MTSPTFILVPGHWHTTAHLAPLTAALTARSLTSKPLQLHTVGRKPPSCPRPRYSDDVSVIYAAVVQETLAGNDVVLVLHSYAGVPGAEAINRLVKDDLVEGISNTRPDSGVGDEVPNTAANAKPHSTSPRGSLVSVIFIGALTVPAKTVVDPKDLVGPQNPGFTIDNDDMSHHASPWHYFFNDLTLSAAKPWVDLCTDTYNAGPFSISSDRWHQANIHALLCIKDNSLPLARLEGSWGWLEEERPGEGRVGMVDACHTPWVSRPEDVADWLVRWGAGGKEGRVVGTGEESSA